MKKLLLASVAVLFLATGAAHAWHSPLAINLVAFGECAFVQSIKAGTHTSMNGRSARLDDDEDLIIVLVAEPVEGHE